MREGEGKGMAQIIEQEEEKVTSRGNRASVKGESTSKRGTNRD